MYEIINKLLLSINILKLGLILSKKFCIYALVYQVTFTSLIIMFKKLMLSLNRLICITKLQEHSIVKF